MNIVVRASIVYFVVWAALRVLGKRDLTHMSPLELVFLLFIPQLFSRALTHEDYSLTNAIVGATTLLALVFLTSALSYRSRTVSRVMLPKPTVLVADGAFIVEALAEERVSPGDVYDAMHKVGFARIEQVRWAVLQADGTIAIIGREPSSVPHPPPPELGD